MEQSYQFKEIATLELSDETKQYKLVNQIQRQGNIVKTTSNEVFVVFDNGNKIMYKITFENSLKEEKNTVYVWEAKDDIGEDCIFMVKEHIKQIHLQVNKQDDMFKKVYVYLI